MDRDRDIDKYTERQRGTEQTDTDRGMDKDTDREGQSEKLTSASKYEETTLR